MPGRRIRLTPILLEAFFVVLGVALALAGNEWRLHANAQAHAETARASILEEIRANQAATHQSHDYHGRLLDSLRTHFARESPPPGLGLFSEGFIHPVSTLTTAWETANATDAVSHMAYDEVLAFSRLYTRQQRYERSATSAGTVLYGEILEHGAPGIAQNYRNLSYLIGAFYFLERELLAEYERVLAEVEAPATD